MWTLNVQGVASPRYLAPGEDTSPLPPSGTLIFRTQLYAFRVLKLEVTSGDSRSSPHTIFHILSEVRGSTSSGRRAHDSPVLEFIILSQGMMGLHEDGVWVFAAHDAVGERRIGNNIRGGTG